MASTRILDLLVILVIVNVCLGFHQSLSPSSRRQASSSGSIYQKPTLSGPLTLTSLSATRKIDVGTGEGVSTFGKDLVNHELLTANDEFLLSRQFKLGLQIKAQRKLMTTQLERPVTDDELAAALGLASADQVNFLVNRGKDSKKLLVKANMRLVFHICKYYRYRGVAYPDLVQEGTFGLIKAVDKYDPERGFRFSTYASWWIKQSVSRAIAEKSRLVRLPVHIHDLMVSLGRAERHFVAQNSRKPSPQELAERLALPLPKVELLVRCSQDVSTIDTQVYNSATKQGSQNEVQVRDRLVSQNAQPTSLNERSSVRSELRRAMGDLSEREAQIVEMRFGLADGNQMTLEEIGKQFCVTRERIRQIEARALSKMRSPVKAEEIKEIFQDHSLICKPAASIEERSMV